MKRRGKPSSSIDDETPPSQNEVNGIDPSVHFPVELEKLIGLGERSLRKSYYPELKRKISELERFQVLVDNAKDFIFLVRLNPMDVVHANHAALGCFGTPKPLENISLLDLLGKEMSEEILCLSFSVDRRCFVTFQAELPRLGSASIPVEATASLHELDGVEYAVIVARDISERIQAEQALNSSAQRISAMAAELEFLLTNMGDFLYRRDSNGKITYVSPSVSHVTGYSPEEFRIVSEVLADAGIQGSTISDTIRRILIGEEVPPFHVELLHKAGNRLVLEVYERPYSEAGVVAGGVAVARDITERIRATEETRRLKSLLASIIDAMPSILVGVDPQGRVMQWNKQAELDSGLLARQAMGLNLENAMPRLAYLLPDVIKSIESQQVGIIPRSAIQGAAGVRFENVTIFPLPKENGGTIGAVIRLDDVTEQARLEQIMIQTEKMMSVGGLAAGMAHEINNPLGGILQGAQNIMRRFSPELPANIAAAKDVGCSLGSINEYLEDRKILRMLEGIRDSAVRAADIVHNMLSFARKSETSRSTHQLNEIIDNTVRLASTDYDLKKSFDFRHIDIVRDFAKDLPQLTCSRTEIEQVLLNLLRNSAQAMVNCDDPKIVLRTSLQKLRVESAYQNFIVIEVEDNGPGMDEQVRMRVFEPFFTTKEPGVGTGLGLSVSYFIITENHMGQMEVDSVPGKGTKFTIRLPL